MKNDLSVTLLSSSLDIQPFQLFIKHFWESWWFTTALPDIKLCTSFVAVTHHTATFSDILQNKKNDDVIQSLI